MQKVEKTCSEEHSTLLKVVSMKLGEICTELVTTAVTGVQTCALPILQFDSWVGKIHWERDRLPTPVFLGFTCGSVGKESACNARDLGSIPGLGRSPGEGKGYPLQYSGLENSMDCIVHGVSKSRIRLSGFHFTPLPRWSSG